MCILLAFITGYCVCVLILTPFIFWCFNPDKTLKETYADWIKEIVSKS